MRRAVRGIVTVVCTVAGVCLNARADFTYFFQLPAWQQAAGPTTTIDFVQPVPTLITDDYASLGVLFTEANDYAAPMLNTPSGDGWGLYSGPDSSITIQFTQPVYALAFHVPGSFDYKVYSGDTLLLVDAAVNPFRGITSTVAFDRIVCYGGSAIDNLYFGPPIPAPGTLALAAVLLLGPRRLR
jgi:hypothetical protein